MPYLKNSSKDNFYCEINNRETFFKLLEIYNSNFEKFDISFDFTSSGTCRIKKKAEKECTSKNDEKKQSTYKMHKILMITGENEESLSKCESKLHQDRYKKQKEKEGQVLTSTSRIFRQTTTGTI